MRNAALPSPSGEGDSTTVCCGHMGGILQRTADGTASPLARILVQAHTATCGSCRTHLAELKAADESASKA